MFVGEFVQLNLSVVGYLSECEIHPLGEDFLSDLLNPRSHRHHGQCPTAISEAGCERCSPPERLPWQSTRHESLWKAPNEYFLRSQWHAFLVNFDVRQFRTGSTYEW